MDFDSFIDKISNESFIKETAANLNVDVTRVETLIVTYTNEAKLGYNLIQKFLIPTTRFLEVGAGIGILSAYLHKSGYEVIAIEPSGKGFDLNYLVGKEIEKFFSLKGYQYLDLGVEDLDPQKNGSFDCIYSINVLEHLPNVDLAFEKMNSVLSSNGSMVHTCPNYHVPYEPHFGVPLVPFVPSLSKKLLPDKIIKTELWQSLNFISYLWLLKVCRNLKLNINFKDRVMYQSMERLGTDPVFAKRHTGFITMIYKFLSLTKLINILKFWPVLLSTPMIFECRKKS